MKEIIDFNQAVTDQETEARRKFEENEQKLQNFLKTGKLEDQPAIATDKEAGKPSPIEKPAAGGRKIGREISLEEARYSKPRFFDETPDIEKNKKINFGEKIDSSRYGVALDRALQLVGRMHEDQTISQHKNPQIFYAEVAEKAVREAQNSQERKPGEEFIADGLMFKILAAKLKRKYEETKEPGTPGTLNVSIYSTNGAKEFEEIGVIGIVECSTDNMLKEKFYLTPRYYKRNINKDVPEPSTVIKNFKHLGVDSIAIPLPSQGFSEEDVEHLVISSKLPNKIGNNVAAEILNSFKKKEVYA
jgi:hypothetical protein